jgi:hypothetical protein
MYLALDLGTLLHFPFVVYKCHVIHWNLFCRDMKVLVKPVNKHKLIVGYIVHFTDPYSLLMRGVDIKFAPCQLGSVMGRAQQFLALFSAICRQDMPLLLLLLYLIWPCLLTNM